MTDDLKQLIASTIDAESARHARDNTADAREQYRRAVRPRRAARRAIESAGVLAAATVVGMVVYAGGQWGARAFDPQPGDTGVDPALHYDRDLWITGAAYLEGESVGTLADAYGGQLGEFPACESLDARARLEGEGTAASATAPGAVQASDGSRSGLYVRDFSSAAEATAYLAATLAAAEQCGLEAAGTGAAVSTSTVAIGALEGEGISVVVAPRDDEPEWRVRVHAAGTQVLAVVSEPGAKDLSSEIIRAWFTYEE